MAPIEPVMPPFRRPQIEGSARREFTAHCRALGVDPAPWIEWARDRLVASELTVGEALAEARVYAEWEAQNNTNAASRAAHPSSWRDRLSSWRGDERR